ncbi:hypothetical protein BKA70DRAFT_1423517 [Coprinopsis sp. MPI-PUGE-AT-0042]|nr:hypothetical protein BKA70DRAFT_1423517 [Coprinopsis sp. MPI-PUGE-AT-0042]
MSETPNNGHAWNANGTSFGGVDASRWAGVPATDAQGDSNMNGAIPALQAGQASYPTPSPATPRMRLGGGHTASSPFGTPTGTPSYPAAASGFINQLVSSMGCMMDVKLRSLEDAVGALQQTVHGTPAGSSSLPRTPRQAPGHGGEDADDEDDGYESPTKRKAREVDPLLNRYNSLFRDFIAGAKVQLDLRKPPTGTDNDTLHAFNVRGVGGPTIPLPQFAFQEPLTSQWNQEIVGLIVDAFLPGLTTAQEKCRELGEEAYPDRFMTKAFAVNKLQGKLRHTFALYRSRLPPPSPERVEKESELRKKLNRRSNRRRGLHVQRMKVANANLMKDPQTWAQVLSILNKLGPDSMSSDESETGEISSNVYWRIPKPWLSPSITALMRGIDIQKPSKQKPGNPSRYRIDPPDQQVRTPNETLDSHNMAYVGGLPSNWYNRFFVMGLRPLALEKLDMAAEVEVPSLAQAAPAT